MQVTAVGELTTIDYNQPFIRNIKDHLLRFGIISVLNKLQCHDVIALKPC